MTKHELSKLFEDRKIRTIWDDEQEKWYFSIVDVVGVLTDQPNTEHARNYWKVLKHRLKKEGNESVTNCNRLKLMAEDGKQRLTDVADMEQLFRIIQSIPSPKAEPIKQWMAHVASERIDQLQDPERSIQQAMMDYKQLGYSDNWINQRLKSIEIRKDLTDQWKLHNVEEGIQYATLTDIIYQHWAGKTAKEYKQFKGLKKENLRDNMTNEEIIHLLLEKTVATRGEEKETFGQRAADKMAAFAGSWGFILSFSALLLLWIIVNLIAASRAFDPYPFILLNLVLSCIAAVQAPLIMMSQQRQEQKDRCRNENDYKINLKSEIILKDLHKKLDYILEELNNKKPPNC